MVDPALINAANIIGDKIRTDIFATFLEMLPIIAVLVGISFGLGFVMAILRELYPGEWEKWYGDK